MDIQNYDEELLRTIIEDDIDRADAHHEAYIAPKLIEFMELYKATPEYYEKKFPRLSRITGMCASDVADTIEWALPSLLRIFFSSQEIIKLEGAQMDNDPNATAMEKLISFQLQRQANGFLLFHDWFKLALKENAGVIKSYWLREFKDEKFEVIASQMELQTLQASGMTIIETEPFEDGTVRVVYASPKRIKNQPKFETMSMDSIRFSPEAEDIEDCNFVAQVKFVTVDYLRRRERDGVFQNVDAVVEKAGVSDVSEYATIKNPSLSMSQNEKDEARKRVKLYECYMKTDINGDGILEDVIVHYAEGTILKVQENTMGRHPFFIVAPIRDPNSIYSSKGFAELVGEIQDLKTALLRQVIYNIAVNNDKQAFVNVDAVVDVKEFIDGKKAVRVNGDPKEAVFWSPMEQLQPQVYSLLEYIDTMKENRTGITKYNQGLDANSLNKTATGINAIMGASTQRLEMIARIICESGVVPFYRHLIKMNQMFQDDDMTIRITGGQTVITPDDLKGEINVVVNAGIGTGDKQQKIQQLMQLVQMYPQMMQAKIAGPQHAAYAIGKIIEEFGWKNTNNFLFTPQEVIQQMQQEQPAKPEEKVSVSVSYKDLPPDGKMQLMQQLGIQLDPQMVMMMEVLNGAGKTKGTAPNVGEGSPSGNDTGVSGRLPPTREE